MSNGLFGLLMAQGQEFFGQLAGALMANPQFVKAVEHAMRGKAALDEGVARGLKEMNIPTRTEFKKALRRIEALEAEIASLKEATSPPKRRRAPRRAAGSKTSGG